MEVKNHFLKKIFELLYLVELKSDHILIIAFSSSILERVMLYLQLKDHPHLVYFPIILAMLQLLRIFKEFIFFLLLA